MPERFIDRADAGRQLGRRLLDIDLHHPVVLALPRGGAPVAVQVARLLEVTWDVLVVRKIGAPQHREYGIGAVAEGGVVVTDADSVALLRLDTDEFAALAAAEQDEVARRVVQYRGDRALPAVEGRDVVVVDDGLARGVTAEAALRSLLQLRPAHLVLAVPTAAPAAAARLCTLADTVVSVIAPPRFSSVGEWYHDFRQLDDDDVVELLSRRTADPAPPP